MPSAAAESTLIMPSSKLIKDLAKEKRGAKQRIADISGTLGSSIGDAVNKKHVDRKALNIACQLDAMDDERLAITYFHLLRYLDDLGVPERAGAQEELFDANKPDAAAPAGGKGTRNGKGAKDAKGGADVVQIGDAARKVAEKAGEPSKPH